MVTMCKIGITRMLYKNVIVCREFNVERLQYRLVFLYKIITNINAEIDTMYQDTIETNN